MEKIKNRSNHPLYNAWNHMMFRCYNPKAKFYSSYGGRGIVVVERWHIFENFVKDMGKRPKGLSLDRINNDGPYSPENCRWATLSQQARNRRSVPMYSHNGQTKTLIEWTSELRLEHKTIWNRINVGWTFEKAISFPISKSNGGVLRARD